MRLASPAFLAMLAVSAQVLPANAAVVETLDVESLTMASDLVVTGTVAGLSSRRAADGKSWRILTDVVVRVDEALVGDNAPANVTVTVPGGVVGDEGQAVFGAPRPSSGQMAVFFLTKIRGSRSFKIVGFSQGFMPVTSGSDGRLWVKPNNTFVQMVGPREPVGALPLDDLLNSIRNHVEGFKGIAQ